MRLPAVFAALTVLSVSLSGAALAGVPRMIPPEAKKVVMDFAGNGAVAVGDKAMKLSPGAQIRDAENRLMLQGAVRGEYRVRAIVDINGQVSRVWILTPQEIAAPDPKQ
ncbi:MAG: hypothetical protein J0M28_11310 [Thauera sp.]|nr:hypothetical protein [Thauera sp.]